MSGRRPHFFAHTEKFKTLCLWFFLTVFRMAFVWDIEWNGTCVRTLSINAQVYCLWKYILIRICNYRSRFEMLDSIQNNESISTKEKRFFCFDFQDLSEAKWLKSNLYFTNSDYTFENTNVFITNIFLNKIIFVFSKEFVVEINQISQFWFWSFNCHIFSIAISKKLVI